ncbi:glycosyltransferase family 4 protein [Desulfonatronum thioautotrophicum]|uniref:glycosyltransferase family 4 protein n=1 Tax=Desulfonatronum thioautotrophicum TaxID=617001 RepID=UPI000A00DD37|nr:glycosyltransferase family 4 protein [Desulfonatronum thioautotrophicum]
MPFKALFVSTMCLLDQRSGAALSVRTHLENLAAAGWECHAVTASLCDGNAEYPKVRIFGPEGARPEHQGKCIVLDYSGVRHHILHTRSTVGANLTQQEANSLAMILQKALKENFFDLVITYGSSPLSRDLQNIARKLTRKMVFFLANDSYHDPEVFSSMDVVICPSMFLRDLYRERLGIRPVALRDTISEQFIQTDIDQSFAGRDVLRRKGFVTYVNPSPVKGGTLFLRLVNMAFHNRPDITFLVLEGRLTRSEWIKKFRIDPGGIANVFWMPNQSDMRRVYQRTSILLFPAFWQEASGRIVAEAQLNGIPVIASDRGGIPEQLNGGGICLPNPPGCNDDFSTMPTEEQARPWLDAICRLLDDPDEYDKACTLALEASKPFHPSLTRQATVDFYTSLFAD